MSGLPDICNLMRASRLQPTCVVALEGWPQTLRLPPCFETPRIAAKSTQAAPAMARLLSMRFSLRKRKRRLRRLLLQVLLPLAVRGEAVHHRAVGEGALRRRDV